MFSLFHILALAFSGFTAAYDLPQQCTSGIMTTPSYGLAGALFTGCANLTIPACPSSIYNVLLDFPSYPLWNTFTYSVSLPSNVTTASEVYVGMPMVLHTSGLIPGINTTSNEAITFLEPEEGNSFMAWRYDGGEIGDAIMQAEHVSLLVDLGEEGTRYVSWETYYGAGALAVLPLEGSLEKEWGVQASDLRARMVELGDGDC